MAELSTYRAKRRAGKTPEPIPSGPVEAESDDRFVIQEHHARALHWDFRLERQGVLVSWAVPKGLPADRKTRRLAVRTEDHPLDYADFEGEIPHGEYGGGSVSVWDRGRYDLEKWSDREIMVVLHGERVDGRYVLIHTGGNQWLVHRMDDPADPAFEPLPELVRPMLATAGPLPRADDEYGFEFKWDGIRAICYVDGGRIRLLTRNDRDVTVSYPELRALGEAIGARPVVLDGEIVAFGDDGVPSFGALQERMHVMEPAKARRGAQRTPVVYLAFDVLHLDGRSTVRLAYEERRALLDGLGLAGTHWQAPPWFRGGGAAVLAAADQQRLEGVVAKRLGSVYQPGRRSSEWIKVKHTRTQEVVVVGWTPGQGRRQSSLGALLLAVPRQGELRYAGKVGTGFSDAVLDDLGRTLAPLERADPPVPGPLPRAQIAGARWVQPRLVGEVTFTEWTREQRLRHPSWRGLRPDKNAGDVVVED
ncbi:MAG TPA: non-homologous end-joining DNA ligase [Acidimicrobiales bacterium]|nr:non-homologous end-joining DNA ligase [Acidimicrobiales bacterium]